MEVKGQPTAAAESSPRAHSAAEDESRSAKEATGGGPPSKEAGDGMAEGRPPLSKEAAAGEEVVEDGLQTREGEGLVDLEADREGVKKPAAGAGTGTGGDEAGTSGEEPKKKNAEELKNPAASAMPGRAWVAGLGKIGERMLGVSTSISGYQGSLAHLSEFLQRIATYAPDTSTAGPGPAVLTSIAWACGNAGAVLGHAAATVQGATSIGILLGGTLVQAARLYGPEVVLESKSEPEQRPEASSASSKTRIIVSSVEQAAKVIKWIGDDPGAEVDVDVDQDVTPFMAIKIYEEFRSHGAPVLSLISGGATMKAKRAAFYDEK